jgi:spore coat protein A, manganese oxidase
VLDFSKFPVGRHIVMNNLSPKNNINYTNTGKVMAFEVVGGAFDTRNNAVPDALNPDNETMLLKESQSVITRPQELKRTNGQWTIDGFTWDDVVASNFTFCLAKPLTGTAEIWELSNPHGGWFHPVHIHLIDFRVLDRNGRPPFPYERGPKDVVYVGENETVRVLIKFRGRGRYMTHCHNLVHEDHDMMGQFDVLDPNVAELGPFARPARALPEKTQL